MNFNGILSTLGLNSANFFKCVDIIPDQCHYNWLDISQHQIDFLSPSYFCDGLLSPLGPSWPKFRSPLPLCGYHTWPAPPEHLVPSMFHPPLDSTHFRLRQSTFKTHTGCSSALRLITGFSGEDTAAILVIWRVCDPWLSSQSSAEEWWETLSGIVRAALVITCFVQHQVDVMLYTILGSRDVWGEEWQCWNLKDVWGEPSRCPGPGGQSARGI